MTVTALRGLVAGMLTAAQAGAGVAEDHAGRLYLARGARLHRWTADT